MKLSKKFRSLLFRPAQGLVLSVFAGLLAAGSALAQDSTVVTRAEAFYNDDGSISVGITLDDGTPVSVELRIDPRNSQPQTQTAVSSNQNCISTGNTYVEALENYAASCSLPVTDCDPYDGQWYCSHLNMTEKPSLLSDVVTVADNRVEVSVVSVNPGQVTSFTDIVQSVVVDDNQSAAQPADTAGESSVESIASLSTEVVEPVEQPVEPVVVTLPDPVPAPDEASAQDDDNNGNRALNPAIGRIASGDLLVLHYDNAPDPDDGHALVAGRVIKDFYGFESVLAVNGTYGYQRRGNFNTNSESLFAAAWPSGLNAFRDRDGSVATSAAMWSEAISQGNQVWVMEGGPSDFTADVLRSMPESLHSSVNVVQHSHGWNEDNTNPVNVAFVENRTNYIRIDNGNLSNNNTANLNQQSQNFVNIALASQWGDLWRAAFDYLSPNDKLDFSDTVELLWVLDIPLSQIAGPDDFAEMFLR